MSIGEYLLTPEDLADLRHDPRPIGFIDLSAWPADAFIGPAAFPLIGVGDPAHPLATALDAILEPPISPDSLLSNVLKAPKAAAACAHLLRSTESLPASNALRLESMCYAMLQGSAEHLAWREAQPVSCASPPCEAGNQADSVKLDRLGDTLVVRLDQPFTLNAIDRVMRDQLYDAFEMAHIDRDIRLIKLRAEGRVFSVGADLSEFGTTRDPATAHALRVRTLPANLLANLPCALDVHAPGACIGSGLEIAAFATTLTASPDAWFQLPEIAMGIIPGAGGCVSIPRRIGRSRALLMMLSGRKLSAKHALEWGLIDSIEEHPARDDD